jgi:hypothetical protein
VAWAELMPLRMEAASPEAVPVVAVLPAPACLEEPPHPAATRASAAVATAHALTFMLGCSSDESGGKENRRIVANGAVPARWRAHAK